MKRPKKLLLSAIAVGAVALLGSARDAAAQTIGERETGIRDIDRQRRFDELQRLDVENRLRANQEIPVGQRTFIDYGGYLTLNYYSIDDRQNNNHGVRQVDFVAYGRLNLDAANELFARGRISYYDYNPGDNFTSRQQPWGNFDLERGYYRFDLAKYEGAYQGKQLPYNFVFQAGRDLIYWANGLTMGQVIDGGIIDLTWRKLSLELIAGVTPVRTVDIDTSRPNFDHNTRRGFFGAMLTGTVGQHHPFIYALSQRDYNSDDFLAQGQITTKYSYNSYYLGAGSSGSITDHLLYGAEMVYEGGHTFSNSYAISGAGLLPVPQTRDQISAFAADFRLDYLCNDPHNTRVTGEAIFASGDHDRGQSTNTFGGNLPGTRDLSFNGFGLVNTGLAFGPEVSNLQLFRLGGSIYPLSGSPMFRRLQIGTDVFLYNKLARNAAFDERTDNKHFLGWEPDLYMNWQIASDVTLAVRYGIFFPSDTLIQHEAPRQFFYTGITFAF